MGIVVPILELAAVFVAGFFLTTKVIPWLFVRAGRLCGFAMKPTPVTRKRIARFRRIKRGSYAFTLICTLYVISLFLEFLVNDKALVICYDGRCAFPALSEWAGWLPFVSGATYVKQSDFGLVGDYPVHFRTYQKYCRNPELVGRLAEKVKKEYREKAEELASMGDPPPKPEPVPEPPRFSREKPADPGENAAEEERAAYEEAQKAWQEAWEDFQDAHADAIYAYEDYRYELEDWRDYQMLKDIVGDLAARVPELEKARENFKAGKAWIVMPLYPFGPRDHLLDLPGKPPYAPTWWPYLKAAVTGKPLPEDPQERAKQKILPPWSHVFGTTDNGLDVLPQLLYGFRIAVTFALVVALCGYTVGIILGGIMGYYGKWTDIVVQRVIEIYGSIPFLYTIMIIASVIQPGIFLLAALLFILRSWLVITYYVRGEFYREKAKDYVQSAIGTGVSDWKIMITHILPNSLVPVVTWAPFGIVSYILTLVSLDYLGFGLPPGTPSWGYLLEQGRQYVTSYPHLILIPSLALAATLFCVVVVGEAVREAFDPKVFSRLR
jgi:ABC-type microcin C transport system permease subunit YejE